jgi:hypothetical protein
MDPLPQTNDEEEHIITFSCNQCDHEFRRLDTRWECTICPEYDLCDACHATQSEWIKIEHEHQTHHEMTDCLHDHDVPAEEEEEEEENDEEEEEER